MTDQASADDVNRLIGEINKLTPSFERFSKMLNDTTSGSEKDQKRSSDRMHDYNDKMWQANRSLEAFSGGMDGAVKYFSKVALAPMGKSAFIAVAAMGALWEAGTKLNETWREMTDIGHTFGGSMMNMYNAASKAGLPLDTFAKLQKQNNVLINATGDKYWEVNKSLSDNIVKSGMYGMSLEQLGTFTGTYMEASRKNGSLQNRTTTQLVGDMDDLAVSTTALAKESDKTREQIAELAASAMSSALAIAGISTLPAMIRGPVGKAVQEATTVLAALPGQAGEYLSKFFANSLGINSALTGEGKEAIDAGLSGLAMQMNDAASDVKSGRKTGEDAAIDVQQAAIRSVNANLDTLRMQAAAGNQAAGHMIEMFANLTPLTKAELEQAKLNAKNAKPITALMASLGKIFTNIETMFGAKFTEAFGKTFAGFNDLASSPVFKLLANYMGTLGTRLGTFLGTALTASNINNFISGMEKFIIGITEITGAIITSKPAWDFLGGAITAIGQVISVVTGLFDVFGGIVSYVGGYFKFVGDAFGLFGKQVNSISTDLGYLAGIIVAGAGAFKLFNTLSSLFSGKNMIISAASVIVNGGLGVGGAVGAAGAAEGALGAEAGLAAAAGGAGLKGMLGKGLGKMGGMKGLGIGLAAGLIGTGINMGADKLADNGYGKTATGAGMLGSALQYGATGAMMGSMIGPWGTAIGAGLGGLYGAYEGYSNYSSRGAKTPDMGGMVKDDSSPSAPAANDPMTSLIDEIISLRKTIQASDAAQINKLEIANRLLSKIEVSVQ